ncbi:MAG: response regulator [Thermodesulfovibrionales bacterium]|nr:response regulator [Thermodesulfovibrionales bacterium]
MKTMDRLKDITSQLKVLYVEDEDLFRMTVGGKLRGHFKEIIFAENGLEGLKKYFENDIDLLITDNLMPVMNGLEMIQEIRKKDTKTPIILVTGFIDTDFLIKSINLGVTQFVAKPINFDNLFNAIEIATQRVILENLERKTRQQEIELFKYREKYHSLQQERAFRKELNIIKNDLFMRKISIRNENSGDSQWFCSYIFKPLDIMSGDSYSIRRLGDDRYLFFLIDAMGKGLSASVTTMLSTSYINHITSEMIKDGNFTLQDCIESYQRFIKPELIDEEIVCLSLVYLDFRLSRMVYANFSMPPIMLQKINGEVEILKSNNLPLMKVDIPLRIQDIDISDVSKIMLYSDGLNECYSTKGELYNDYIRADFKSCCSAKDLFDKFRRVMTNPNDDITIVFLKKKPASKIFSKTMTILSKIKEITLLSEQVKEVLSAFMKSDDTILFMSAFSEIILNSYEHGHIELPTSKKRELIANDTYDDYLRECEKTCKSCIEVTIEVFDEVEDYLICACIKDSGCGFDVDSMQRVEKNNAAFSGRGIKIAESILDGIYYNQKGNEATLIKKIKKGG